MENEWFLGCSNIQEHYNEAVIYLNFGTPKNNEFSIWIWFDLICCLTSTVNIYGHVGTVS